MKFKLVFIFILFSLLGYSQEAPVPSPKILIKVPLGESTLIKNHTISFIKVIEDSRCKNITMPIIIIITYSK